MGLKINIILALIALCSLRIEFVQILENFMEQDGQNISFIQSTRTWYIAIEITLPKIRL
jgi:hypothetical protein